MKIRSNTTQLLVFLSSLLSVGGGALFAEVEESKIESHEMQRSRHSRRQTSIYGSFNNTIGNLSSVTYFPGQLIDFPHVDVNSHIETNLAVSTFAVPRSGDYRVTFSVSNLSPEALLTAIGLYVNQDLVGNTALQVGAGSSLSNRLSLIISLNAGDALSVRNIGGNPLIWAAASPTVEGAYFTIERLHDTAPVPCFCNDSSSSSSS